jgi:hypothetical protein
MIQAEVTFGWCDWWCGVWKDTCIVRKLPRIVLWEIPADMRKTLVGLHKFGQEWNLKENLTISSALWLWENIIEETVELYGGKINDIFITIGGTPVSESANFYNEKLPRLWTKIDENGRIFIWFDHIEEETRESIFTHFDTALSTLLKNWRLMPEGKSLWIGLGKNNSKDFVLWLECYEDLRLAIEFGIATGHENLDKTIDTIRKIGNFQQDREIIFSDIREWRTGFSHFFILEISGQKLPILIQVLPAVEQSDKIESTPGGDIVPLIAPKFVAPFHNIYAMNARKNRISHELYQRTLAEITGTGDAVETYNHRFLEVLHQNS